MATVSTFNIALVASTGRFVSSIARAERQWNSFARSVQRQSRTLPKALREAVPASLALGRNVAKWAAVATAALSGLSAAGVKLAADFEQSQIAFETMLGDAERARRFLRELEVYARRTPFGFVGLQQSARQLLAYGFTADRVLEMITPIGDTVAAMGGGQQMLEAIIRALGQMQAKGKVSAEEMLQLTEQGVAAWAMLAESIGVSVPEAMELAQRGAITSAQAIDAILQGMTRRFAGAMARQADTIAGRWEQIKDSVTTIVRAWGQDVVRITGLAAAMGVLADAIERVADAVSLHGFIGALERAFPPWVAPVIIGIAGAIMGGLVPAIVAWLIPALKKLGVSLWATLRPLTPWMAVGAAVALTAYVLARNWNNLADVGQRVWTVLGGVAMYGASLVVRASGLIYTALSWIVPALRGTAESVMAYANSLRDSALQAIQSATASARVAQQAAESASTAEQAAQAQETLAAGLEAAQKAAEGGIQSFDEVHQVQESLLDSFEVPEFMPPDLSLPQINVTESMVEGLSALDEVVSNITNAVAEAWDRLTQSMEPVRQAVEWMHANWPGLNVILENTASIITLTLIPALVTAAARATWSAAQQVAAWVTTQAQAIASIATQVANMAVLAARWIWLGAVAAAQGARVAAGWVIAMGPIGWAIAAAAALAAAIWYYWEDIVAAVATAQAWFETNVAPVWETIANAVTGAWNGLKQTADEAWTGIKGAVLAVWEWAEQNAAAVWNGVTGAIQQAWDGLSNTAATVWNAIRQAIEAVWNWASEQASAVWDAVSSAITSAWATVEEAAGRVWDGIKAAIDAVWTWVSEQAGAVWNSVSAAITAVWDGLSAAATTSWEAIRTAISTVWDWAETQAGAVWTAVRNAVESAWNAVAETATRVWQSVRTAIEDVWTWAESTAATVWNAVASAVTSAWDGLVASANSAWTSIRATVVDGWETAKNTVSGIVAAIEKAIDDMASAVERIVSGLKDKVLGWWDELKRGIEERANAVTNAVRNAWQWLYDVLVGHSIVPDMVEDVTSWFDRMEVDTVAITQGMLDSVVNRFTSGYETVMAHTTAFGNDITSWAEKIKITLQSSFEQAFDGILKGTMTLSQGLQSILDALGGTIRDLLVDQLKQAASQSLSNLAQWAGGVLKSVAATVAAVIQQAYATLVAYFAWSGPAAPVLASGVIGAAMVGIASVAKSALGSIVGLAQGGIVTGPTLALMGEGYRREAVIPLERDNVIAQSVGDAVLEAMLTAQRFQQASGGGQTGDDREIILKIDGATFARLILPHLVREGQRQGMDVAIRPAMGV